MRNMKDFLGNPLDIGDTVIYMDRHYRDFRRAKIVKFTPKMVFLETLGNKSTWHDVSKQISTQLIKVAGAAIEGTKSFPQIVE